MVADIPREPHVLFDVSWQGTGTFDGDHDALNDPTAPRLLAGSYTSRIGRDTGRPHGRMQIPTAGGAFDNRDRLLSGEWPGSDLYQLVEPGKPVRVAMTAGVEVDYDDPDLDYDALDVWYDGIETIPRILGVLDEPQQNPSLAQKSVGLSVTGALSRLRDNPIAIGLQHLIRLDLWLHMILDAAGVAESDRDIGISDVILEWAWADPDEGDALDHWEDACLTEGVPSYYGEDRLGRAVFQPRGFRGIAVTATEVQATIYDSLATDVEYDADVDYDDLNTYYDVGFQLYHQGVEPYASGRTEIVNRATCVVRHRELLSTRKVWEFGTTGATNTLTLGASETRDIEVTLPDPVSGLLAPVLATDYAVFSGSLASSPTIVSSSARRAVVRWVAGAGGAAIIGVTSNGFQLRAQPCVVVFEETVANSVDASASIAKLGGDPIGVREKRIEALAEINPSTAITLCDAMVSYFMEARPQATVAMENVDWNHLAFQLVVDISWRIALTQEQLGLTGDFHVEQIEERREPGKLVSLLTVSRAPIEPSAGLWDDGLWDLSVWGR